MRWGRSDQQKAGLGLFVKRSFLSVRPTSTSFLGRQRFGGIQQQAPYSNDWCEISLGGFSGATDKSAKKFTHQTLLGPTA